MSLEDPFFLVRDEVTKAICSAQGLYQRWCELVHDPSIVTKEEFDWTTNELRNSLRSIDWDLEDLEETISIVKKNPRKFKITEPELRERDGFIRMTKKTVEEIRNHMTSPKSKQTMDSSHSRQNGPDKPQDKYQRLDNEMERSNQKYLDDTFQQQQHMMQGQDENLDMIGTSVTVLKDMSRRVGTELDEQAVMLDDLNNDMDRTDSKLDSTMKKMAKVLHMSNDKRQWTAILVLVIILIVVLILFFIL